MAAIFGQDRNIQALRLAQEEKSVSHAYLFFGPHGSGKKTLACFFASALNCDSFPAGPCGSCLSCRKIKTGNHPDIHLVLPEGKSLKIAQVRQVKKQASFSPHEGRYQVFILDASASVTPEAANSLLKLLEDAPAFTVLIVLAENPETLPPTIVSRCQLLALQRLNPADLSRLLELSGLSDEQLELAASLSEGIPGRALEAAAADWQELFKVAFDFLKELPGSSNVSAMAARLAEYKNLGAFLDILLTLLRDLLVWKLTGSTENMACRVHLAEFKELAPIWEAAAARKAMEAVLGLQDNLRSPVNVRMALERSLRCIKEDN